MSARFQIVRCFPSRGVQFAVVDTNRKPTPPAYLHRWWLQGDEQELVALCIRKIDAINIADALNWQSAETAGRAGQERSS